MENIIRFCGQCHGEKENLKAEELFYGPRLLEKENPVLREYLLKQQEQNQTLIRQLSGSLQ